MNCFPCKGPACNTCKKYDRINELAKNNTLIACPNCGEKAALASETCPMCGHALVAPPGQGKRAYG